MENIRILSADYLIMLSAAYTHSTFPTQQVVRIVVAMYVSCKSVSIGLGLLT